MEYLQDAYPSSGAALFPADPKPRGVARRLIREADEYLMDSLDEVLEQVLFVPKDKRNDAAITAAKDKFLAELPHWRAAAAAGKDFLVGAVGAADFTVYPFFALALRMQKRHPSLGLDAAFGPQLTAWMRRVRRCRISRRGFRNPSTCCVIPDTPRTRTASARSSCVPQPLPQFA